MARPTKYNKKICDTLPDLFRDGQSVAEVCVELGIAKDTFYNWQKAHKEFSDAIKKGLELSEAWWERLGRRAANGKQQINPTVWIFNMKNRFGWRDQQSIDLNASGNLNVTNMTPEERKQRIAELAKKANVES
jgi:transposase